MTIVESFILGIVEGFTEFLPISSTAHLMIAAEGLGIMQTESVKSFEIIIQLGAILAVVTLFLPRFFEREILKKVLLGFIPTAILGFFLYTTVKTYFLGNIYVVPFSLVIGGIILLLVEYLIKGKALDREVSKKEAVIAGFCQVLAFIPGVSRSGAVIAGGLLSGASRRAIAEFSFLLAVPTMLAATGLELLKNFEVIMEAGTMPLLVGFIAAYVTALFALTFLLSFVEKHTFAPFAYYRIVLGILLFVLLWS